MEKKSGDVIATFAAADGRVIVKTVTQYRQYNSPQIDGVDDVIEFIATNGKQYIAFLRDIILMKRSKLSVLSLNSTK